LIRLKKILAGIALLPVWLLIHAGFAASRPAASDFTPARVDKATVQVDGKLDEPAWRSASRVPPLFQQCPETGQPPSEKTEVLFFYDQDFLYVGFRCRESDPSNIVSRTLERDSQTPDQDGVGFLVDTLNDHRSAYGFIVSPGGVRTDIAVTNDGEAMHGLPWNVDWNAFWDATVSRDGEGWTAELRIPFSSLRFNRIRETGAVEMGIIFWRYLARDREFDVFPAIPNDWRYSAYKPSQALDVVFADIGTRRPLYIRPYVLSGLSRQYDFDAQGTYFRPRKTWDREVGLDVKYNLTQGLIFDGSYNTDFAQVEADDEQINLTRFSLQFPEKRSFFQERTDLFSFRVPGQNQNLFYSRKIGIVEDEIPVPILGGVRLAGRTGKWDIGLIEMQTQEASVVGVTYPAENFGVVRLKRTIFGNDSFVGAMVTSRLDFKGQYSLLSGIDTDIRLKGPIYLQAQAARSFEPGSLASKSYYVGATVQSRIQRGFTFAASGLHLGEQFNPALGFIFQNGIDRAGSRLGYTWFPERSNLFFNYGLSHQFEYIWDIRAGRTQLFSMSFNGDSVLKSGATAGCKLEFRREFVDESFNVGVATIPPGLYQFWSGEAKYETSSGAPFHAKFEVHAGGYYEGRIVSGTLSPYWTANEYLTLGLDYTFSYLDAPRGTDIAHIPRLRIKTALNRALSLSAFLQYNTNIQSLSANIRLRFNPSEGQDLYIVYNEGISESLVEEQPRIPRSGTRAIIVKYSYTFGH